MSRVIGVNVISDGLIFYLDAANGKCYPKSGVNVNDLKSNIGGTLENGVGYNADDLGSFDFDGIDDYIDCTNDPIFDFGITDAFSIETWVKFNDLTGPRFIVSKWVRPTLPDLRAYTMTTNVNKLTLRIFSSNTSAIIVESDPILSTGVWYHLVVTYDGSVSANGVNLYINNSISNNIIRSDLSGVISNTVPLQIGGQDTFFTDGQIANVKIYNRELSQNEVDQNYNALKYRFI